MSERLSEEICEILIYSQEAMEPTIYRKTKIEEKKCNFKVC